MREIKFRAWEFPTSYHDGKMRSQDKIINNTIQYLVNEKAFNKNRVIMQYTGLKDKNGIEIYESDIVKDSSNRLMIAKWDDRIGTSRFIFIAINTIGHIKAGRIVNTHEWITSTENDIEVIGNIYKNKELLNN